MRFQKTEIKRENRENSVHESLLESISAQIMKTLQCDITNFVLFTDILPNGYLLMLGTFMKRRAFIASPKPTYPPLVQ